MGRRSEDFPLCLAVDSNRFCHVLASAHHPHHRQVLNVIYPAVVESQMHKMAPQYGFLLKD
jgi:hypothetical protein